MRARTLDNRDMETGRIKRGSGAKKRRVSWGKKVVGGFDENPGLKHHAAKRKKK